MSGDDSGELRSVSRMMELSEDPSKYRPRRGDVLELCPHIRIQVTAVTSNGKVSVRDIEPRNPDVDAEIRFESRDPDPNKVPPLGVETWASTKGSVSVYDLQRLLQHGWELRQESL